MSKKTLLICDDEDEVTREWHGALSGLEAVTNEFDIRELRQEQLADAVRGLEDRQRKHREGDPGQADDNPIDHADLLVVDFDLLHLRDSGAKSASETGERIAYLARCYSSCGYIVALNQFDRGTTVFDLTLNGHLKSFADLNISSRQLANPGLWTDSRDGFRPWSWPCLSSASKALESRVAAIKDRLDEPILSVLGLDGDRVFPHFNREQLRFLSNREAPKDATFADLVDDSVAGLQGKDLQHSATIRARIAAARVHKWLERAVLPGQHIITDLPHLVSRFPSLVANGSTEVSDWNATTTVCASGEVASLKQLTAGNFDWETWLSRPAWIWPLLQTVPDIAEIADPWAPRFADLHFAEDLSLFISHTESRDFTAEVDSPWNTRYVVDGDSLAEDDPRRAGPFSVDDVSYQPGVQFTL